MHSNNGNNMPMSRASTKRCENNQEQNSRKTKKQRVATATTATATASHQDNRIQAKDTTSSSSSNKSTILVGITTKGGECKVCLKKGGKDNCHHNHNRHVRVHVPFDIHNDDGGTFVVQEQQREQQPETMNNTTMNASTIEVAITNKGGRCKICLKKGGRHLCHKHKNDQERRFEVVCKSVATIAADSTSIDDDDDDAMDCDYSSNNEYNYGFVAQDNPTATATTTTTSTTSYIQFGAFAPTATATKRSGLGTNAGYYNSAGTTNTNSSTSPPPHNNNNLPTSVWMTKNNNKLSPERRSRKTIQQHCYRRMVYARDAIATARRRSKTSTTATKKNTPSAPSPTPLVSQVSSPPKVMGGNVFDVPLYQPPSSSSKPQE
ncbi:MAG: hypothetical protein ACI8RD_005952, partial [Bacillariaceae sp.]